MGQENSTTKKRKWKQLSEKERYQIEALLKQKVKPSDIAAQLDRNRRTIEREIKRGSVIQRDRNWIDKECYRADVGQRNSDQNASNKGRPLKIGYAHDLVKHIEKKIKEDKYSPDAVIGEIKKNALSFGSEICTKTLYNYIDRGLFLGISNKDLPVKRDGKRRKHRVVRKVSLRNPTARSIEDRPKEIESREEYGHWEMDCVVGSGKACLLVLTERSCRLELIHKMSAKTQENVIKVLNKLERKYRKEFPVNFKSITMDNGSEFLDSEGIEKAVTRKGTRTTCYYAHPYSAYERGSNEVGNKLIRRFVPKGVNIDKLTVTEIKRIERWMNDYPRRMFDYKSANEMAA